MHAVNEFLHGKSWLKWKNCLTVFKCYFCKTIFCFNPLTCMCLFSFHKPFLFWEYSWRTTLVCMWKPYKNIPLLFCKQMFSCQIKGEGVFSTLQSSIYWQSLSLSLSLSHTHIPENKIVHHVLLWNWDLKMSVPLCVGKGKEGTDTTLC